MYFGWYQKYFILLCRYFNLVCYLNLFFYITENNHFVEDSTPFKSEDHLRQNNPQESNSTITDCSEGNKSCKIFITYDFN